MTNLPSAERPFRVLVVEDDADSREILLRRMARAGYAAIAAADVDAARTALGQEPDLVLLDVMLPGTSGLDFLKEIRTHHGLTDLPVVMVTALNDSERLAEALGAGANDYVTKPIDPRVLEARVRTQVALKEVIALKREEAVKKRLLEQTVTAREEERLHLSRELHDDTAQRLTSLLIGLDALRRKTTQKDHLARIQELVRQADATMSEVRRLAQGLRPALLEELGFKVAMEQLSEECMKNGGPKVRIHVTPFCETLPWSYKVALFRVVQEAINNVRKHAKAESVSILVQFDADTLRAVIEDDGVGFDFRSVTDTSLESGGLGLVGMRERLQAIGGRLEVETSPGRGTALSIEVPWLQGVAK